MDLFSLWLPILLSAVAVWFLATIASMALPHHKNDFIALPTPEAEDAFMQFIRTSAIKPGNYLFPDFRTSEALKSEKVAKAIEEGPIGHLSLWQPPLTMASKMAATFAVYLAVSILLALLATITLPLPPAKPAETLKVFEVVTLAGILAYSFSFMPSAIWFGAYKRTIIAGLLDGIAYGALTGAIFAWRWPH